MRLVKRMQCAHALTFLFQLTLEAIKKDHENVALQAIEFWATICDEEIYIMDEIEEVSISHPLLSHTFSLWSLSRSYLVGKWPGPTSYSCMP